MAGLPPDKLMQLLLGGSGVGGFSGTGGGFLAPEAATAVLQSAALAASLPEDRIMSSTCMHSHPTVRPPPGGTQAKLVMSRFDGQGRRREALPAGWRLPGDMLQGFVADAHAAACERSQDWPFLRLGMPPKPGQRLFCYVFYHHDGSHPQTYNSLARMVGHVSEVLPPPPVGVYATYVGEEAELGGEALRQERREVPALGLAEPQRCPPGNCGCSHTREEALRYFGAVHGLRVKGKLRLAPDDEGWLGEQWNGKEWDVELIMDDAMQQPWVICRMELAGHTSHTLLEAYPPGDNAHPCKIVRPGGLSQEYGAPPVRVRACANCDAVGGSKAAVAAEGSAAAVIQLSTCASCKRVQYCGRECQAAHWHAHRDECRAAQRERAQRRRQQGGRSDGVAGVAGGASGGGGSNGGGSDGGDEQ